MVLDISKYIENLIRKEMKVSHFNGSVRVGKTSKLKSIYVQAIKSQYGDSFLQDADYIAIFMKDDADGSSMKKLFELVNRALGKDANNMTQSDFKVANGQEAHDNEGEDDKEVEQNTSTSGFVFMKITVK